MKKISTKGYILSRLQLYGISRVELAAAMGIPCKKYFLLENDTISATLEEKKGA